MAFENLLDKAFGAKSLSSQILKKTQAKPAPAKPVIPVTTQNVMPSIPATRTSTPTMDLTPVKEKVLPDINQIPTPYFKQPPKIAKEIATSVGSTFGKALSKSADTAVSFGAKVISDIASGKSPMAAVTTLPGTEQVFNFGKSLVSKEPPIETPIEKKIYSAYEQSPLKKVVTTIEKKAEAAAEAERYKPSKEWEGMSTRDKILKKPAETLRILGPDLVATTLPYLIPVVGAAVGTGSIAASTAYDIEKDMEKNGITDRKQKEAISLPIGLGVGILERIFPDELFVAPAIKKQFIRGFVKDVLGVIGKEGVLEEGLQSLLQSLGESKYKEVTGKNVADNAIQSIIFGSFGAGAFRIAGRLFGTAAEKMRNADGRMKAGFSIEDVSKKPITFKESSPAQIKKSGVAKEMADFVEDGGEIIQKDGKAVGWIKVNDDGVVEAIEISPEHQRQGIAKEALQTYFGDQPIKFFAPTEQGKALFESIGDVTMDEYGYGTITPKTSTIAPQQATEPMADKADDLTSSISKAKAIGQSFDEWVKGQGKVYEKKAYDTVNKTLNEYGVSAKSIKIVGSQAKGTAKATSDIDIIITPDEKIKSIIPHFPVKWNDAEVQLNRKIRKEIEKNLEEVFGRDVPLDVDLDFVKKIGEKKIYATNVSDFIKTKSQLKSEWDKVANNSLPKASTDPLIQEAKSADAVYDALGFTEGSKETLIPIKSSSGRVVGGIDASVKRDYPDTLLIHYVRILPEAQGKGSGTEAIAKLFKDNPKIKKLEGHATAESKSFWQKQGATFSGSENNIFTITRKKAQESKSVVKETPPQRKPIQTAMFKKHFASIDNKIKSLDGYIKTLENDMRFTFDGDGHGYIRDQIRDEISKTQHEIQQLEEEKTKGQQAMFQSVMEYRTGNAIFEIDTEYNVIRTRFYELARNLGLANAEAEMVARILTDKNGGLAQAAAFKNVASFEALVSRFAAEHEMGHLLFQRTKEGFVMDRMEVFKKAGITRADVMAQMKQDNPKIKDEAQLEELLMIQFEVYTSKRLANKPVEQKGTIRKFFDTLFTTIHKLFAPNKIDAVHTFYNTILDADQKVQNVYLPTRNTKYQPDEKGILDYSFGKHTFIEKKPDIEQVVKAKKYIEQAKEQFEASEDFGKIAMKEEMKQMAKEDIHIPMVKAIKNSYLYRKEGTVGDEFNHATIMYGKIPVKNGKSVTRYIITNDPASYAAKGYTRGVSVDEIYSNSEYGYENRYDTIDDMVNDMVERYNEPVRSTTRIIDEELSNQDPKYIEAKTVLEQAHAYYEGKNALHDLIVAERREMKQEEIVKQMKGRAKVVNAIGDYFKLDRADMAGITRKDFRTMGNTEFDQYVKQLEEQARLLDERRMELAFLQNIIQMKNFKNVDNFRQLNGLPEVNEMTTDQIRQFQDLIAPYEQNDEFLPLRLLETLPNTPLSGITTIREGIEIAAEQMGISKERAQSVSNDIFTNPANKLVRLSGETELARVHPFMSYLVQKYNTNLANEMLQFEQKRQIVEALAKEARKSNKGTILQRIGQKFAPTDEIVFQYLSEADPQLKDKLAENMTPEEIQYAEFISDDYAKAYAHLLAKEKLGGSRFEKNYITNIAAPILESIKNGAFKGGIVSMINSWRGQQATLNILQGDTQNILPYEKFFKYSIRRGDNIIPTQNVAAAYLAYMSTYHKMRALDAFIPEMMLYAKLGSPTTKTPHGLETDRRLANFVKEWINTKKGRKTDFGGYVPQGGWIDIGLKTSNMWLTIHDLGLNPTQALSIIGEKAGNFVNLGAIKYAKGIARAHTKQGKMIEQKYKSFTGESLFEQLSGATKDMGDKTMTALFAFYVHSSYIENVRFLLGSLTDQEYKTGEISPERLAEMRIIMGRYRVVSGAESIIGATSIGKTYTKYRAWALPWARTTLSNIEILVQANVEIQAGRKELTPETKRALWEFTRITTTVAIGYGALMLLNAHYDDDERKNSLKYKYMKRGIDEMLSFIGAAKVLMNPATTRLSSYLETLADYIRDIQSTDPAISARGKAGIVYEITPSVVGVIDKLLTDEDKATRQKQIDKRKAKMEADIDLYNNSRGEMQRAGLVSAKDAEKQVEAYVVEQKEEFEKYKLDVELKYLIDIRQRGDKAKYQEIAGALNETQIERLTELWYETDTDTVEKQARAIKGTDMEKDLADIYKFIDTLPYTDEGKADLRYKAQRAYKIKQYE